MSLKFAVDEASHGLQQVALLFDCAPVSVSEKIRSEVLSSPVTASSLSPMSSVIRGDATWTSAVNTLQVCYVCWLITSTVAMILY